MKRILQNLALTALAAFWCVPSSAVWEKDFNPRTTASEIETGHKYVLSNVCSEMALSKMLKAPGLAYVVSDYILDDHVFIFEDAGQTNEYTGEKMWFIKSELTGLYFNGTNAFDAKIEDAKAITIGSARKTTVLEKGEGWTEDEPVWPNDGKIPAWDWKDGDALTFNDWTSATEFRTLVHIWGWDSYAEAAMSSVSTESGTAVNPWYAFEVNWVDNPLEDLAAIVETYHTDGLENIYKAGNAPGWYKAEAVQAFNDCLALCDSLLYEPSCTDAQLTQARIDLLAAKKAVEDAIVPMTDGWYFFKSGYPAFLNQQKKEKGVYDNGTQLCWGDYIPGHAKHVFHFEKQEDGTFAIKSLMTGRYLTGMTTTSEIKGTTQNLIPLGAGQFRISDETGNYHANGHGNGSGTSGVMTHWTDGLNSSGAWMFEPVSDPSKLDSLVAAARQEVLTNDFKAALAEAREDSANGFTPKWYIKDVKQFSSNAKDEAEGSFEALIDGNWTDNGDNKSTFFCSSWHNAFGEAHYLQVDLSETPLQNFVVMFAKRPGGNAVDRPTYITILGSNDGEKFDSLTYIPQGGDTMPTRNSQLVYRSGNPINLDQPYKYLRFRVDSTNSMASVDPMGFPFFTLGEFNITDPGFPNDEEASMALREDMASAYAALNEAITKANTVNPKLATREDIDALRNALAEFDKAYPHTDLLTDAIAQTRDYAEHVLVAIDPNNAEFGMCKDASTVDALTAAADEAQNALDSNKKITRAEINTQLDKLTEANNKFLATIEMPAMNTWYFMKSLCRAEGREDAYETLVYPQENRVGANIVWGANINDGTFDTKYIWKFVPVEGKEGVFGMQNIGTGYYMGADRALSTPYQLSDTLVEFKFHYVAGGQLSFIQNENAHGAAHAAASGSALVPWTSGENSATAWTFVESTADNQLATVTTFTNRANIYCLPYDINGYFYAYNEDGYESEPVAYQISGARFDENNDITEIGLAPIEAEDGIPAGTPFILVIDDVTEAESDTITLDLGLEFGSELNTESRTVNGLVGVMSSTVIDKAGIGYFSETDGLTSLEETKKVTIAGQRGYIDGTLLKNATDEGEIFLKVKDGNVITDIAQAVKDSKATVSVYSVDGQLVRKNVKATEALKGLKKGLYVVNGKVLMVK